MNIRQAMLLAAAQIEEHPETFNFLKTDIPDCGTPGCALGWTAFYLGKEYQRDIGSRNVFYKPAIVAALGISTMPFYNRMDDIVGTSSWIQRPGLCAIALRRYANKYHPETIEESNTCIA